MRRALLTFLVLSLLTVAGRPVRAGDAGQETPFVLGAGAASLGMGGGFTALAEDATAVYYNPAGLTRLDYQELSLMHTALFEGTIYNFGAWVYPVSDKSGVGLGYMRIGTGDIVRSVDFEEQYTFGYAHSQFILSYGHRLLKGMAIGASLKVVNQSMDDNSVYAVGADVGFTWRLYDNLSLGFIARDIIPARLELDGYTETTPYSFMGGLAIRDIGISEQTRLTASLDLEKYEQRDLKLHGGAQLSFYRNYFLRAGYDRDNLSFGAGLKIHRLKFDYAYKVMDYIEDSHNFSLSILIGSSTTERMEKKRRMYEREPAVEPVVDERQREFMQLKTKADYFFRQFELDSALVYYNQSLEFDPGNNEVLETIASIEQAKRLEREQQDQLRLANREREQFIERYYSQAVQFYEKKYYTAARDILNLIFEIEPDNTRAEKLNRDISDAIRSEIEVNWSSARQAREEGRLVRAIEAYNRILELDPGNADALRAREEVLTSLNLSQQLNLGISLYKQGKYDEAKERFQAVLDIDNREPVALEYMEKLEEAHTKASTLEDLQKDKNIWSLYLEGIRHMRNKEYQKAIDAWEMVLKVYPGNVNTLHNIEQARLRLDSEKTD